MNEQTFQFSDHNTLGIGIEKVQNEDGSMYIFTFTTFNKQNLIKSILSDNGLGINLNKNSVRIFGMF